MPLLSLNSLVKQFGTFRAVDNLNLDVEEGEFVCLLGPSGCGKTTTLRMLGGFIHPDSGDILIDGRSVMAEPPERRPTAMVFQRYTLWPHMDVWNNVAFGLKLRKQERNAIDASVRKALQLVGLPDSEKKLPSQLSGGQQQRVALARALVLEPRILLLDEPFSNLDAQLRVRMREEVRAIQQRVGITSMFVTHDQSEALAIADRIVVMANGKIEQIGPPAEVYARPATLFVASFVGTMNLVHGVAGAQRKFRAGEFEGSLPENSAAEAGVEVVAGFRPEDVVVGGTGESGVAARVQQVMDMGHYRQANIETSDGTPITAYVDKGRPLATGACRITVRNALIYVDGLLAGTTTPQPGAA